MTPQATSSQVPAAVATKTKQHTGLTWGRYQNHSDPKLGMFALIMLLLTPFTALFAWSVLTVYKGELLSLLNSWVVDRTIVWPTQYISKSDFLSALQVSVCWVLFQAFLYTVLPGPIAQGQITPGGNLLSYCVNGWNAYWLTFILFCLCSFPVFNLNLFSPTIVYDNWTGIIIMANIFGYSLTVAAYIKARFWPSHPEDVKWTGSFLYDLFMGAELNPRFGSMWDWKLFLNGRPGIIGWTIINLSMAAAQLRLHGTVSLGMILVNIFQMVYVADFFYYESWYLRTIDIAHDHFGFYFAWGDTVWLPLMYTIQAQFLVHRPDNLSWATASLVTALFAVGYWIFRSANNQKDYFRSKKGDCKIWGAPARYIKAKYVASDGSQHEGLLLCSGFWGIARHTNYLGDLLLSLATCLACGTLSYLIPFFYIIYMTMVLVHRVGRDHQRCSEKYGAYWTEYCRRVPYKIVPYLY